MGDVRSVFVSYRRDDSGWAANALGEALRQRLGPEHVFVDNSSIGLGRSFSDIIISAVQRCDVLLALIGSQWDVTPLGDRLADPQDWVRREILLANKANRLIVPILVDRERGPSEASLPQELGFIASLHYAVIRQGHPQDIETLMSRLALGRPALNRRPAVGVERRRAELDQFLRRALPSPNRWSGNKDRLVDLALAVLGPSERLTFLAPCRVHDRPPGSAAILITGTDVIVVEVGEDFLICGEIRLGLTLIRRVEVVPTLFLFADVVLHADTGESVRLQGLFRRQARDLADHVREPT